MLPKIIVDSQGRTVYLDRQLAAGGEGTVYSIQNDSSQVAKLYHLAPSRQTVQKLTGMVHSATKPLLSVSAWPSKLLFSENRQHPIGFMMPRLNGFEPIHHLYNPAQRLRYFPRYGWNFLVQTAWNCAAAFDEVHKAGALVGDINQSNVQVSSQAIVKLIDCDSFQYSVGGQTYLCEVGVPHYIPPELQGKSLTGLVRSLNHDRFGMAVVLFQLLVVGRHPYAGIPLRKGDLPFEEAIANYMFAYGPNNKTDGVDQPPYTPLLTDLPSELGLLFRRAFERGSEKGTRPSAGDWHAALGRLKDQISPCINDTSHFHWQKAVKCPWCRIEESRGPEYFFGVGSDSSKYLLDETRIQAVLQKLGQFKNLDFPYVRASYLPSIYPDPEPLPEKITDHKVWVIVLSIALVVGVILVLFGIFGKVFLAIGTIITMFFGLWLFLAVNSSPQKREYRSRKLVYEESRIALEMQEDKWQEITHELKQKAIVSASKINLYISYLREMPRQHNEELQRLSDDVAKLALKQHLTNYYISDATIPMIGEGRKQILAAYNILTANDLEDSSLRQIYGISDTLIGYLLGWKEEVVNRFRFDKSKGIPETELRALAIKYKKKQHRLFIDIDQMLKALEVDYQSIRPRIAKLVPKLRELAAEYAQAESDFRLISQTNYRSSQ